MAKGKKTSRVKCSAAAPADYFDGGMQPIGENDAPLSLTGPSDETPAPRLRDLAGGVGLRNLLKSDKGLACPDCGCSHLVDENANYRRALDVLNSRDGVGSVRRTRICRHCGRRIVTVEKIVR